MRSRKFALAGVALACSAGAQAASRQSVSYVSDPSMSTAYVVDWNPVAHTAHLVDFAGAGDGTFTDDGTLRLLTLSTPIETTQATFDCNGLPMTQVVDLRQLAVRQVGGGEHQGHAQVVEIGTTTDQGGCTPGLVTPYGSAGDAGTATTWLDMAHRPDMDDLRQGATLAGMSDTDPASAPDPAEMIARTVTFAHHEIVFSNSGTAVPRQLVDGWFVLDFGTFQRGYTRLSVDARTHAEQWLGAAWRNGAPATVFQTMMVVPNAQAGFGGLRAQARIWNSGLFLHSDVPTRFELWRDGTGLFVEEDTTGTVLLSMQATWVDRGSDLVITRANDPATRFWQRTWVPIANHGKAHFVIESEDAHDVTAGTVTPRILPRVNFYVDEGRSTSPAATPAPKTRALTKAVVPAGGLQP